MPESRPGVKKMPTVGHAHPNRAEASRRKACRARALGRVMGGLNAEKLVERLQLDLGWRWVVGLAPSDRAWSVNAFVSLVMSEEDLVDKLVKTGEQALGAAGRSSRVQLTTHFFGTERGTPRPAFVKACRKRARNTLARANSLNRYLLFVFFHCFFALSTPPPGTTT